MAQLKNTRKYSKSGSKNGISHQRKILPVYPSLSSNMLRKTLILTLVISTSQAFVPALHPSPSVVLHSKHAHAPELNPIDEMCVENVAEFCLHEQCDVEEYEALINQLEDQRDYMINHLANVETLLRHLKQANHPEHDPEEVSELFDTIKKTLAKP